MLSHPQKSRVLLVEDHPITRKGLQVLIEAQSDMEVCGEATELEEAVATFARLQPDLTLVDIGLNRKNGLDFVKRCLARFPQARILVVSMHAANLWADEAIEAGALGFVEKTEAPENLIAAMRAALAGRIYSSSVRDRMIDRAVRRQPGDGRTRWETLSAREKEVFEMIGRGRSTSQIALELGRSQKTIESHRESLKRKLNLTSAIELEYAAARWVWNHRNSSATVTPRAGAADQLAGQDAAPDEHSESSPPIAAPAD